MNPLLLGPLISGGASVIGGMLGLKGQHDANQANARQAATAYQRAVADMKKAGLNPALAYQQGGAQSATMQNTKQQLGAQLATSGQSAAQIATTVADGIANRKQVHANTEFTEAQTHQLNLESLARLQEIQARGKSQETNARVAEANAPFQRALMGNQALGQKLLNDFAEQTFGIRAAQLQADYRQTLSNARETNARAFLQELGSLKAKNEAEAEKSTYKRKFAPYLNDAAAAARIIFGAASAFK